MYKNHLRAKNTFYDFPLHNLGIKKSKLENQMPIEFVSFECHSNCKANLLNLDLNLNALRRV